MIVDDARHLLDTMRIPSSWYSIGKEVDHDAYCLFRCGEGWALSYWERGVLLRHCEFSDETVACEVFIAWVISSAAHTGEFSRRLDELLGPST